MANAYDSRLYAKMLEASKTHKSLAAAIEKDTLRVDVNHELALLLQKKGMNPAPALTAAKIAELEAQTGLPISAAVERSKMCIGSRTHQRNSIGNYF